MKCELGHIVRPNLRVAGHPTYRNALLQLRVKVLASVRLSGRYQR